MSDTVHILALDGQQQRPPMTLVAAQKLASDQRAALIQIRRGAEPVFVLVDAEIRKGIERRDLQQMVFELLEKP